MALFCKGCCEHGRLCHIFPSYTTSGDIILIEESFILKHSEQNILTAVSAGVQIPNLVSSVGVTGKTKTKPYF